MQDHRTNSSSRRGAKWLAYALMLLAPGSFFILPAIWLVARFGARR